MNPPERIRLISESAALLAKREWPEMDLILDQFGMTTLNHWEGDAKSYAIEVLRNAFDDSLQGLHQFLTGHGDLDGVSSGPHPWQDRGLRLFLSHLAAHQRDVGQVASWLSLHGIDAFVAHSTIEPSLEWQDVIEAALRSCRAMVVFLHNGFHESNWCDQEVGYVLARPDVPVLPLKFDLDPYGFLGKVQAANCNGLGPIVVTHRIIDWLMRTPSLRDSTINSLVYAFENSQSFDNTRHLLEELEAVPVLTQEQLWRLDAASTENRQIREALIGNEPVPARLARLIDSREGATA